MIINNNEKMNDKYNKKYFLLSKYSFFLFLVLYFYANYYLSKIIVPGDQVHYFRAYEVVDGLSYFDAMNAYRSVVFSFELIHFTVIWIFSNIGVSKPFLMSFLNTVLFYLTYRFLRLKRYSSIYSFYILITNYYFYVMLFTLEKLKIAYLCLICIILLQYKFKNRILVYILPVIAHFQTALLLFSVYISKKMNSRIFSKINFKNTLKIALFFGFALILFKMFFSSFLIAKIKFYFEFSRGKGLAAIVNSIFLFFITLLCSNRKKEVFIYFIIFIIFILLLGSDRLNMFLYFGFIFFIEPSKDISKLSILLISTYLCFKTYYYINYLISC